jgi:hypothetical protein
MREITTTATTLTTATHPDVIAKLILQAAA